MGVNSKTAVEEQFDRDSNAYLSKHLTPENHREKERILGLLSRRVQFDNLLDIGCGPGTLSQDLLGVSKQVWGVDISQGMINIADALFDQPQCKGKVHFAVGDAENLPFPDEFFDAVVCVGVLRYLDSQKRGLREIYRVLKPNGVVVATFYYRYSLHWFSMCLLYRPLLPLISLARRRSLRECLLKYRAEPLPFSYRKFRKEYSKCGFRDMEIQHSGFDIFPINRLFPRLSRRVYMKAESAFFNSNTLGWLGSICIVKGLK
jgi:ubiquinone/menaquinone biosynthesis C-methylase UbiE